jgi:hypothetical protein
MTDWVMAEYMHHAMYTMTDRSTQRVECRATSGMGMSVYRKY